MELTANNNNNSLISSIESNVRPNVEWEYNIADYEQQVLESLINPALNYETIRFGNQAYASSHGVMQNDVWFYFYFYTDTNVHSGGLNYEYAGISPKENATLSINVSESFFRLDFYKTASGATPTSLNRRMVFTKNLRIPLGEKVYYSGTTEGGAEKFNDYVYVPVFNGSNIRNEENMYVFWFMDDTVLEDTTLTGNTFYLTAKYYNSIDGSVTNFGNKSLSVGTIVDESDDFYFKMTIDKPTQTYIITTLDNVRVGDNTTPIKFYELPI
jgi:hypothetical protein